MRSTLNDVARELLVLVEAEAAGDGVRARPSGRCSCGIVLPGAVDVLSSLCRPYMARDQEGVAEDAVVAGDEVGAADLVDCRSR